MESQSKAEGMADFSHYDETGKSVMVDVSGKNITTRKARAAGFVRMKRETVEAIEKKLLPKGDVFEVARIAGIMAAKKTSDLIPMCHPLQLDYVNVDVRIDPSGDGVAIESEIVMTGRTGAEMEALTAVTASALTIYDMCKAVDKEMIIEKCRLVEKRGGKSDFVGC